MLYHIDPRQPEEEALGFNTIAEYDRFLKDNGLWKEDAPRIVLTGQMGEPTDLIRRLEETDNVVYPVRRMKSFIARHHIDSVRPSAVSTRCALQPSSTWRTVVWATTSPIT